jgi:hypothetical protein
MLHETVARRYLLLRCAGGIFYRSVSNYTIQRRVINDKLARMWKEAVEAISLCFPGGTEKNYDSLSQDSRCDSRGSSQAPPEHGSRTLTSTGEIASLNKPAMNPCLIVAPTDTKLLFDA